MACCGVHSMDDIFFLYSDHYTIGGWHFKFRAGILPKMQTAGMMIHVFRSGWVKLNNPILRFPKQVLNSAHCVPWWWLWFSFYAYRNMFPILTIGDYTAQQMTVDDKSEHAIKPIGSSSEIHGMHCLAPFFNAVLFKKYPITHTILSQVVKGFCYSFSSNKQSVGLNLLRYLRLLRSSVPGLN